MVLVCYTSVPRHALVHSPQDGANFMIKAPKIAVRGGLENLGNRISGISA